MYVDMLLHDFNSEVLQMCDTTFNVGTLSFTPETRLLTLTGLAQTHSLGLKYYKRSSDLVVCLEVGCFSKLS